MNAVAQHKTRHIVSEIDVQLWAREQRRRCFARTFGTPLRKVALGSDDVPPGGRACVRRLFQSAPNRGDSGAQFGYSLATLPSAMARLWRDAINRRGEDVTLVHLPEMGIRGNTHVPFSDLNNHQIADLLSEFLEKKDWTDSWKHGSPRPLVR